MRTRESSSWTDAALVLEVKKGEVLHLATLFDRHHRKLLGFFVRMTGNREAGEDLVQEVFLRILKYRKTFRPESCFRTWMYQIAKNVRVDCARSKNRDPVLKPELVEAVQLEPDGPDRRLEVGLLWSALAELPEEKREILLLARFEGLTHEQIGTMLGCEAGTVKVRVFRALQELRKIFFKMTGEKAKWNVHR